MFFRVIKTEPEMSGRPMRGRARGRAVQAHSGASNPDLKRPGSSNSSDSSNYSAPPSTRGQQPSTSGGPPRTSVQRDVRPAQRTQSAQSGSSDSRSPGM